MRVQALAVLVLVGALAAGCGGGAKSNGEAAKPAAQVVRDAVAAATGAKGVHVSGSIKSGGEALTLDFHIVQGAGGAGSMTEQGLAFQFVRIGPKAYIKGSDAFYEKFAGAATAQLLHNRWLEADATKGDFATLTQLTDIGKLLHRGMAAHGKLRNAGETTYKGQKVVAIDDTVQHGTLYVAATGRPYPVAIVNASASAPGTVTFTDWNKTVALTVPKNPIDLSKLGG